MQIGNLFEIVLFVEDMQTQVRFYQEVLGLEPSIPLSTEGDELPKWATFKSGACTLALHAGGQKRFGQDAPQFYFLVADIDQARAALLYRGVSMSVVSHPDDRSYFCAGQDPEGNWFGIESHAY
jgi:predicted enzyme related to lactoylglutathione lyase